MNIYDYQKKCIRTLNSNLTTAESLSNLALGLAGETGEVVDIIKKHLYQGHDLDIYDIHEEIGDILFYAVNLATVLDLDMEDILEYNHNKLLKRYPNGFKEADSLQRVNEDKYINIKG